MEYLIKNVNHFVMVINETCNLNCGYCYVKDKKAKETISKESIDSFVEVISKKNIETYVQIDIFGGEPLINWPIVQYLIEKVVALENNAHMVIFTNATLLTKDILNFTKSFGNKISFNFSVDGNEECHNSQRVYNDGRGSYDDVMAGIQLYKEVYQQNYASGMMVMSSQNLKYIKEIALNAFNNNKKLSLSYDRSDVWTEETFLELKDILEFIQDLIIKSYNSDNQVFNVELLTFPYFDTVSRRRTWCGAGRSTLAIVPNGDIYPCQRFYNNKSGFVIGNINTYFDKFNPHLQALKNFKHSSSPSCRKCELNEKCSGQCHAAAYESSGNVFKPIPMVCKIIKAKHEISDQICERLKDNESFKSYIERTSSISEIGDKNAKRK